MTCYRPFRLNRIEFGSFLAYTPKFFNQGSELAYELMKNVKRFTMLSNGTSIVDRIINLMAGELANLPFKHFFRDDAFLVPVPKSQLMRRGTLWVPREICIALQRHRLGKMYELLSRVKPVRQSSRSHPSERPLPEEHYHSMRCQKTIDEPKQIVLIDDVITRGHTVLGGAWRLA